MSAALGLGVLSGRQRRGKVPTKLEGICENDRGVSGEEW